MLDADAGGKSVMRYSQYKYKFYLNANHSIMIDEKMGQVHPHTWEIMIDIVKIIEEFVPFSVVEKTIDNIPQNVGGFGTLLTDIGEGKNVLQSLSNYEQNTSFVGRPFNGIAIGGSLLNKIINKNDNNNSVNRQKINNTFEQLRIQNAKN